MKNHEGTIEKPYNQSKGCGGAMRVAPIAQYSKLEIKKADMIGAKVAALTHGHELGCIPNAMMVHIIHKIINSENDKLGEIIDESKNTMKELFPNAQYLNELIELVDKAIELSKSSKSDLESIQQLGEGWGAEETLAIAIYCSLKYQNDFEKAIIAAVNRNGDSDSTGSVTGNILGLYWGLKRYLNDLLIISN